MAEASPELKDRIFAEIAVHLSVYGRDRYDLIRERPEFAHIIGKQAGETGRRKFFRWVNYVSTPDPDEPGRAGRKRGGKIQAFDALNDAKQRALLASKKNIPAAPSPAYLMRKGPEAENQLNFLAIVHELMRDAHKLRAMSVTADETQADGERIKNPHLFGQAFDKRLRLMETSLKVMQEIWDLQYQQQFYNEITDVIVTELAVFPEIQERVIRRLADLNNRRGMTLYAERG